MFAITIRRHLRFIGSVAGAVLLIGITANLFFSSRSGSIAFVGDPSAPRSAPETGSVPHANSPAVRQLAAAPRALPNGGRAATNLIDIRTPDKRFHDAARTSVACAVGQQSLVHDPALDAAAVTIWRAEMSREIDALLGHLYQEYHMSVFTTIPGLTNQGANPDDPCLFGGIDLRTMMPSTAWNDVVAIGVAFFSEPEHTDDPSSSLVVVGRRTTPRDPNLSP